MTRKGVWDLQEVRDKYLDSAWVNTGSIFSWGTGECINYMYFTHIDESNTSIRDYWKENK